MIRCISKRDFKITCKNSVPLYSLWTAKQNIKNNYTAKPTTPQRIAVKPQMEQSVLIL